MEKFLYMAVLSPEEDGGYSVEFPDLPGCLTCGDSLMDAAEMAADAAKTYVASLMAHGDPIPKAARHVAPEGCEGIYVFFETEAEYIVDGEVMSAAEASRELGVSAARVTHMIGSGILQGYRRGRRTYVTAESVKARKADARKAGRPRGSDAMEQDGGRWHNESIGKARGFPYQIGTGGAGFVQGQ